jgi:hypothetical protein
MDWLRGRAATDGAATEAPRPDEIEILAIVELDPEPRRGSLPGREGPAEPAYLRDRRDPTGTAGLWRAIEGL